MKLNSRYFFLLSALVLLAFLGLSKSTSFNKKNLTDNEIEILNNFSYVAGDFHVHVFNHNRSNERNTVSSSLEGTLDQITANAKAGGFDCTYHIFTEHMGFRNYNVASRKRSFENLKSTIDRYNTEKATENCSYFDMGWEYTPPSKLRTSHVLVHRADNQEFLRAKGDTNIPFLDRNSRRANEGVYTNLLEPRNGEENSNALLSLAHPCSMRARKYCSSIPSSISAYSQFIAKDYRLSSRFFENESAFNSLKAKYSGVEFPRAFSARGGRPSEREKLKTSRGREVFTASLRNTERLYFTMLALGYNIMPMINGDRHSHGFTEKPARLTNFFAAIDGHTTLIIPKGSTNLEALQDALSNRRGYITFNNRLELVTLLNGQHMGSKLDFNSADKVQIRVKSEVLTSADYDLIAVYSNSVDPREADEFNEWVIESDPINIARESNNAVFYEFSLDETIASSPFLYFKLVPKRDLRSRFNKLILRAGSRQPIALSAAYINLGDIRW